MLANLIVCCLFNTILYLLIESCHATDKINNFVSLIMYRTSITLVRSIRVSLQQNASNSTFKRPKPIPDSVVNDDTHVKSRLAENRPLSSKEWTEIRSGIIAKDSFINEVNVDATILARCLPAAQLEVGKSYVGFLRDQGIEPNLATVGKLLRLYHASEKALTEVDKEDIVKM